MQAYTVIFYVGTVLYFYSRNKAALKRHIFLDLYQTLLLTRTNLTINCYYSEIFINQNDREDEL